MMPPKQIFFLWMTAFVTFLYGEISYENTFECSKIKFTLLMIMNVELHIKKNIIGGILE
jgi:hypothetical protein